MKSIVKFIKWFYPGLKIKRWIILMLGGVVCLILFGIRFFLDELLPIKIIDGIIFFSALILVIMGTISLARSFFDVIYPKKDKGLIDILYEKRYLSKGPKIVTIGGGTGLSSILEGLKEYTANISAIVTVADEGGSSGRLREEFGILPPGDIRNCLVSLAEVPQLMRDLFQYRFQEGNGIKGHSFGNIFITAMTQVTGSFRDAIEESSRVLAIRGRVIPASLANVRLKAEYVDGTSLEGEDKINQQHKSIKNISLLPQDVQANPEALEVIKDADIVIVGPGSLFTSILPNLLIKAVKDALLKRTDIMKIYLCNVMTQHGETDGYTASDHLETLIGHAGRGVLNTCLVNCGKLDPELLLKYAQEKSFPVLPDVSRIEKNNVLVFEDDIVSRTDYLRHDPFKTAKYIINIYNQFRKKWNVLKKKS
ncbi:MAG: YvcK family protein [Candidatus Omnitrophica bacterium]|nr:YvcK family protein [Candidatus Omnitrophota bacterium]